MLSVFQAEVTRRDACRTTNTVCITFRSEIAFALNIIFFVMQFESGFDLHSVRFTTTVDVASEETC